MNAVKSGTAFLSGRAVENLKTGFQIFSVFFQTQNVTFVVSFENLIE
jgi:hypothetical protein